jgi:hypothetical protein
MIYKIRDEKNTSITIEFERCGDMIFITTIDMDNDLYGGIVSVNVTDWETMLKSMRIK